MKSKEDFMITFPGPVSNAKTSSKEQPFFKYVRFPIPPIFCNTIFFLSSLKYIYSNIGTNGAPSPPAITSATLKSLTTLIPVKTLIICPSPICNVEATLPFIALGACQIV